MKNKSIVDPGLYSKEYFLSDNDGFKEYSDGLDDHIHPKFKLALKYGEPKSGNAILDLGCGRGELVYYCAKRGAKAFGIDYSKDGIDIARGTVQRLPENLRHLAGVDVGDIVAYPFKDKYDIVFMIEVAEHMHNWQLEKAFSRIWEILADDGKLIIATPNHYYEKYLSPVKRIINIPLNLAKWPIRALKGKYKKSGALSGLKKAFRIWPDRGELNRMMHVNVSTPWKLKNMLSESFDVKVVCEDHSKNILSLLTRKWCGRDVVLIATKKSDGH